MESILQVEKKCFLCGRQTMLECHHALHGTANRKNAEHYGLKVWLCRDCHTGTNGVHRNREKDLKVIRYAQEKFEEQYGREEFIKVFGKNYL